MSALPLHSLRCLCLALLFLDGANAVAQQNPDRVPPSGPWHRLTPRTPAELRQFLRYSGEAMPVVSAHRGGFGPGRPENCLATFEHILRHTFAIIEIDPRRTRDGAIVLHHDATLDRTTTGSGRVDEHTLAELKQLQLRDPDGKVTPHRIPTLDEAIEWARGRTLLVLDQKDVSVRERVKKISELRAESFVLLIVYSLAAAKECHRLNPDIVMEVMVPDEARVEAWDKSGVPWSRMIAFVGHRPMAELEHQQRIHDRGAICVAGTSRNLDRELHQTPANELAQLEAKYRALLNRGIDLFETDLPIEVARLLFADLPPPPGKRQFFHFPER